MKTLALEKVVVRFAGDSGDGIQLTGDRLSAQSAAMGNGLATLPSFPAEIRAPQGSVAGISSFQLQFADHPVGTAGEAPDVLVALNPAALRANLDDLPRGATIVVNTDAFTTRNLSKAGYTTHPLNDGTLDGWHVHALSLTRMSTEATASVEDLPRRARERTSNMFALGLISWMYHRSLLDTEAYLRRRFATRPSLLTANLCALRAGWNYGETSEDFVTRFHVDPVRQEPGRYRNVTGNKALSLGLMAAAARASRPMVLAAYPITPASDILHALAALKHFGVFTLQAEDEIAAAGMALGASYGGAVGVTSTSGPGLALKSEMIGLAVTLELPLVIVDVQRGGPSTGLPTKTEQADLLQAMFGRNGESPVAVVAASSPADCFDAAFEAVRLATTYRAPVILLSDGCLANGSEPWQVPKMEDLPVLSVELANEPNATDDRGDPLFLPYQRDPETLARPWAVPGTPGLQHRIGGLEKADLTGNISYDPDNHELMTWLRQLKISGMNSSIPDLQVNDPDAAEVLVLGWGSTRGAIEGAVRQLRSEGQSVAHAHLRHLNPFPGNLDEVLRRYRTVLVPEMNLGQLATLLRARSLTDIRSYTSVRGTPFAVNSLSQSIRSILAEGTGRRMEEPA